ncbi:MAG TPA: GNAT family N-acetyltransferase [Pyrinomonadaceae bacterium]|nr:GNAT family N-acetyltransferase [Pyrinomonadaceae bacterium]
MEIRVRNNISDEESKLLFGWGEDIFGSNHLNLTWKPKDLHIFIEVDGSPVTHVGLLQHTVAVNEERVAVCGVGGVVTTLDEQGKGYASRAMRHAASLMREELSVDFGLLFCHDRLMPFYERLGWRRVSDAVEIEQPSGSIVSPMNVMILPCAKESWPTGPVKLNSLPW